MLGRQSIIDDQYELNIPQSSSSPLSDHPIHHHNFPQTNYFESPIHYHQNFYDHPQFFQTRPYREQVNIQQTFYDQDRKLMIFPDGNLSFAYHSNPPVEAMYERNRMKLEKEEEEMKWSNNCKQQQHVKGRSMMVDCSFDSTREDGCGYRHLSPTAVNPIDDDEVLTKGRFYHYNAHQGNGLAVHCHSTPIISTNMKETVKKDDGEDGEETPDCSLNSTDNDVKDIKNINNNNSNNKINNISINNNTSSDEDGKVDNNNQPPWNWMKKQSYSTSVASGKTRTKDKYRIVYTELQKVELEKEFLYNQYITIQRKSELASFIGLTDRQVKIWFQNRRAKDRKSRRKQEQIVDNDQPCQAQSTSSVFKSYPMGDHFSLVKNPPMDGFCQPENVPYDYQEAPHSTFFEPCHLDMKDAIVTSLQSSLQRHLL